MFRHFATNVEPTTQPPDLVNLAAAFLPPHPDLYLSALTHLTSCGYAIPPATAASLLRTCAFELSADPTALATVVGWLGEGLTRPTTTVEEREVMELMCEGAMEGLKRLGKPEAVEDVFAAYANSFTARQSPNSTHAPGVSYPGGGVVSTLISSRGTYNTLTSARAAFEDWRAANLAAKPDPKSPTRLAPRPYLTLLGAYARNSPAPHASPLADPAYDFLPLLARDGLPLSPHTFALLVKLELSRRQFGSAWGLWDLMGKGGWRKGSEVWIAALKVINWEDKGVRRSRTASPLARMAGYKAQAGPSGRGLFSQLLEAEQDLTQGRPRLVHPNRSVTTEVLNAFLSYFVRQTDLLAAAVVLETFAVHALEPNRATHSTVVLGLVSAWKAGNVGRRLEQAAGVDFTHLHDRTTGAIGEERRRAWDPPRKRGSLGPGADAERERAAMVLVRRLLEGRQMRVGLWTNTAGPKWDKLDLVDEQLPLPASEADGGEEGGAAVAGQAPPPEWMARRELRDVSYLHNLLRKASAEGDGKVMWGERLSAARAELLPGRWDAGQSGEGGLVEGKGLRRMGRDGRLAEWKAKQRGGEAGVRK